MDSATTNTSAAFSLPLSLGKDTNVSSIALNPTPFKTSDGLFLQSDRSLNKNTLTNTELNFQGMEGFLSNFPVTPMPDVHSFSKVGENPLFPELNIQNALMDEFFAFNVPSLLASQANTPNPPLLTPTTLTQQQPQHLTTLNPSQQVLQKKLSNDTGLGKKKRHKRPRNSFNETQKRVLDDFFDHQSHTPTRSQKLQLAKLVNSTERTVTVWFQNRRQKLVKISKTGGEVALASPKEPKLVTMKVSKSPTKKRSVDESNNYFLSPPAQPIESPMNSNFVPSVSYMNSMMVPNATSGQAPNLMPYPIYNNTMVDPNHYMLSPVTPTFNQYSVYQQMRNLQLNSSPPPATDMMMEYHANPMMFNSNPSSLPSTQDFLHFQQSFMKPQAYANVVQDPIMIAKNPFMMPPPSSTNLNIDPNLANHVAVVSKDKTINSTSL
ncbi:hypothetical protein HMI54_009549 [Coelomomyces lativittatus]|nr:hypothetical protein HMI56_006297 [Coelomomyces lativittatus]KAJ1518186.1 hypothetical protein HMI55_001873 [Coelomomyces lativittatus]KAJ1518722.1 hypothetical protein HMI54_009549 [Coelomomyces lativittatus]